MLERQQEQHLTVSLEPLDDYLVIEAADAETWLTRERGFEGLPGGKRRVSAPRFSPIERGKPA